LVCTTHPIASVTIDFKKGSDPLNSKGSDPFLKSMLNVLDLPVFQLHGHRSAENRQLDADQALGFEQVLDFALHAGERAVLDFYAVAAVVLRLRMRDAGHVFPLPAKHPFDLAFGHGGRRMVYAAAHEIADARGLPEKIENAVVVFHFDHQITGVELPFADHAFAVPHFRDALDRDDDLAEKLLQPLDLDAPLDGLLDRLL